MHLLSSERTKTEMDKKDILTTDWSDSSLNNPSIKSPFLLAAALLQYIKNDLGYVNINAGNSHFQPLCFCTVYRKKSSMST